MESLAPMTMARSAIQQMRGDGAGVAEALHHNPGALHGNSEVSATAQRGEIDAAPGRFVPSQGSAQADRFAGHDPVHRIALIHAVRVHDPGHDLRSRVHVRRRNVFLRPDQRQNRRRIAAGQPFQLAHRQLFRVAGHAALAAAEGNVDDGALPRHPRGQRLHLIHRDIGVVTDAALGRPAHRAVLYAVAFKPDDLPAVHPDRHAHTENAFRVFDHRPDVVV